MLIDNSCIVRGHINTLAFRLLVMPVSVPERSIEVEIHFEVEVTLPGSIVIVRPPTRLSVMLQSIGTHIETGIAYLYFSV